MGEDDQAVRSVDRLRKRLQDHGMSNGVMMWPVGVLTLCRSSHIFFLLFSSYPFQKYPKIRLSSKKG